LPFMFWSFLGIQTNFSSGPFQVTSTTAKHSHRQNRQLLV
jgi:hypothetical protein